MTEIKPWQDRVKPGAFTGVKMEAMLAEIAEHRAAKVEQGKPVAPVAWRGWDGDKWVFTLWREEMPVQFEWQPLFTHPVRPMSDEQIDAIPFTGFIPVSERGHSETEALRIFARLVEAHIKGATE